MKITFVFDGLQYGGIERVGIEYIKLLNEKGYEIQVINLNPELNSIEKEIPPRINILHIKFSQFLVVERHSELKKRGFLKSIAVKIVRGLMITVNSFYSLFYLKRIPNTDVAIAFSGHFNDLMFVAKNFKGTKKIAWLHGSQYSYLKISPGFLELYGKIKNLVCLSCKDDDKILDFNQKYHIKKIKIYNPINLKDKIVDRDKVAQLKNNYGKFILMVGRLDEDKDQETLIRAVGKLHSKYGMKNKLVLVGDGVEKNKLQQLTKDLNLYDSVIFEGLKTDVQNYYVAAAVYAHSSPAEGLPTVLLEAMYYSCPIVSTNSEPGTKEILKDNCGLISPVKDVNALADNIYKMYSDENCRYACIFAGEKRIKEFMPDRVISQFEIFLKQL
ncbi:glycosyltransferase [Clostridiaceae bacterium Marseille-Q4145]|nr:glycosyltransferase [Clostridiaceae bacterium Marseille-Q4145]